MDKLKMRTEGLTQRNIAIIRETFPGCVTEAYDESVGQIGLAVDFDLLRQELSGSIVEGTQERFRLDWPGKRAALATANAPTTMTLRPERAKSVDYETTRNLFIEGDNLDALKLLRRAYGGAVKLIYIDPPYNTGDSRIYKDNFSESQTDYLARSGQIDSRGGKLLSNRESNGRFHSDWMTMMYARLRAAHALLSDDGAIFISIDEGEKANLCKMCDEIFGENNFRNTIIVRRRVKSLNIQFAADGLQSMNVGCEYVVIYAKSDKFVMDAIRRQKETPNTTGKWDGFWSNAPCEVRNATPLKLAFGVPTDKEFVKGWRSAQVMTIIGVLKNRIIHGQDQASSPERG